MATAQFRYAVGLNTDSKSHGKASYDNSLRLLKDFLVAHDGEYLGSLVQDGVEHPDYAVVKMTRKAEEALQDQNADLLMSADGQPFIRRIEGMFFDVSDADGIKFHKDPFFDRGRPECTI